MKKSQLLNFFRVTLLLLIFSAFTTSAWGAKLYLKPGVWNSDNPCYIAYFWGGSGDNQWATMTDCGDGYFSCDIPGSNRTNVKIQRKNPSSGCNHDWNGSWNHTGDQSMNGNDCLVVNDWDNFSWTSYSSSGGGSSTTTTEYYIAGWGGAWDPKAIKMPSDGSYTFPLQLASGDECPYEFKITDGTWNKQWACGAVKSVSGVAESCCGSDSGGNIKFRLSKNADVTIKFDGTNITIDAVENTTVVTCDLVGSFSTDGWTTGGKEMNLNDEGSEYQITNVNLTAGTEVKVKYVDIMAGYSQLENPDIYVSKDDQYDNIVIKETGVYSFYYKISSNLIWLVQESSETSGDDEDNYMEASECDPTRTKIIFTEDFGEFSDIKDRLGTAYSKTGEDYTATVPSSSYDAITSSCTAIKDAGYYAVLANPYYAGCGTQTQGADACSCGGDQWYENITDHTGKTNGGMLFYNCKDGTRNTDILYECTVNVCENTFINFSAYIASATAQNRGCGVKAKVRFILYDAETNEELSRYTTDEISLSETEQSKKWKKIAVMFNSKTADKVTLKLLNLAGEGCGNDLLLDDITFSVCAPSAKLTCSNGTAESNILYGETETLTVALTEGMISGPYYYWQYRNNDKEAWKELHDDSQEPKPVSGTTASSLSIKHTSPTVNYRVIIVPTLNGEPVGLDNVLKNVADPVPCGMYAITNEVKVNVKALELNIRPEKLDICVNSRGKYELTITNPMSTAIEDVQVTFIAPPSMKTDDVTVTRSVGTYNNGIWEIESLPPGDSKLTYEAEATSSENILAKAYVSKIGEQITYSSYEDATLPKESKADGTINVAKVTFDVNPTSVVNKCEGNLVEFTAEATSTCDGDVKYQWVRRKIGTEVFSNITNEINSKYTISSLTEDDALYEYAVVVNIDNCPCVNKTSDVATIGMLEETDISNVELYEYKECATTGELYLYDLVDVSDKSGLIFYETETSTTSIDTEISKKNTGINNDYYFTYEEEGKCVSKRGKVHVTILPKPEAKITSGGSQTFCAAENYTFSISAEAKNGTGIWSVTSGDARIANVDSASTTAVVKAGETATLKWTVANEKCDSSATTTLQVDKLPTITIVADKGSQTVCSTSEFTVAVDDFTGSGIWEILSETSSETNAIIGKPNEKETLVTGIESAEEVELQYTANNGECKSIKSEVVTLKNLVCNNFSLTNTFNDDDKEICLNDPTSLTISITNNSQATSTVIKTSIVLPEGLTYVSHSSGVNYDNTTGLWTIASLGTEDENKTAELTINVIGSSEGSHTVNAIIKEATNTEVEGMEIPSTIKVNALPTAKFKERSSEVCVNPKGTTQVEVEFTGAPDYTLKYKLGDSEYTTEPAVSSSHIIQKEISADATITLISVKDNNGCENTIADQSHNVNAISPAVITIPVPDDICAGDSLTLSAPTITENGSNVTDGKWYLDGEVYTRNTTVEYDKNRAILQYIANSSCGGEVRSNEVNITVNSAPSITINADGNLPTTICAGNPYTLPTVTVKENGSTIDSDSEGWYLGATKISLGEGKYSYSGGTKITLDQGKYYTFSVKDIDKSLVYKAVNDCGETFKEFRSELDVKDCANFTITYSLDKKQVCKGDEVVLTATITNNSDSELRDVILSQSWDGSQIPSKDAAGTNKKIFVTSGDVASVYDEVNNLWKIETFTAHKSATLKITFSAQADESFHIYMKESNDVTYQDDAENPTPGDATLDVLEISDPVVLDATKNYNGICPETSSKTVNLSDLVTRNATDTLHFYDMYKNLLTTEPTFDISTEIPSTIYYINRTEAGKCISNNPIPVTIEVYKPVTASIAATKNTICSGTESDVNIIVDGTAGFTIVYNNGVNDITKPISGKTLNIAETLTSTTTYKLISVTDAHACPAKLDGTESVTITVNALPELVSFDIEDSDKIICDGESTKLKATFTGKAPFKFYINDVETESEDAEWSMDITEGKTYAIKQLSDDNCDSKLTQKDVTLTVESSPVVELDATNVTLNCNNPKATITASGANSYNWSYTDQTGVEQTQTGDKLNVQLSESGQVNSSTTYTVYGYSEKAKCKSASPVTVTVTENKRTPVVSDLVSVNSQDETIEGYKETQIINCKDTELFIKSTIVDNVAAGYSPDDLTYDWAISEDGDLYEAYGVGETISTKTQGIFRLIVTDNETGCSSAAKRIEITENKTTPVITVVESVTTKDPSASEAVKTSVLTCEYPVLYLTPTIESENEVSYLWNNESTEDYLEVSEAGTYTLVVTDNVSFCSTEEYTYIVTQDNTVPTFNVDAIYYLCPSDVVTEKTLSSLLPATPGVTYKFYNEAGEEIKDLYEISADASVTEYYVTGISDNGCESTKTMFSVDFARNVDFTLTTSQTSMMIGGNETVVTVVPDANSDIADTYTWLANGNELPADGLEYSTNLYLDTKFEVTATNRCDSKSQETFVEVLWPTAFTPHNGNGKNDDFAKGMHIIVFNRFYTKIFEGPDGWDGTINGAMNESESIAVPGVYYYSVQLPNGEVKKGTIEIVR